MPTANANRPKGRPSLKLRFDPSKPLDKPSREIFAQKVAAGVPVDIAYREAGYKGGQDARGELRRAWDVDARVKALLVHRVDSDTRARHAGEKKIVDLRTRVLRELERVAFSDARDLVQWDRKPILGPDGEVQGFTDEMIATPSRKLTKEQAASIKSVTTKSGAIKFDVHDKLNALEKLGKALGLFQDAAPPAQSVTVNQLNVGDVNAVDAARRVAFLLSGLQAAPLASPGQVIEGEPVKPSKG